jgi:protein-S-isoprenylcysteine O-methyltransferase Ste14
VIARLARLRVPLGFVCGALVLWLAQPTGRSLAAGGVVALGGELLRVWAAGHLYKSSEVTVSGPYRFFAHPLYVGSSLLGVGLAVAAHSVPAAALIVAYLGATLGAAIRSEEAFLRRTFGERYDRYRGQGARGPAGGAAGADGARRRFSLARAMANREHRAAAGLVGAVLLLLWKATYNGMF